MGANPLPVGTFGRYHVATSDSLAKLGSFGRIYAQVVGFTDVPSYGRFLWFRRALRRLPVSPRRVMDAGSGTGAFALWMAEQFPDAQVLGIDYELERVNKAERARVLGRLANLRFQQGDLTQLNFVDSFDLIYSIDVFEHIADNRGVIRRCYGALRPGGHLLIRIPAERQRRVLPVRWFHRLHDWTDKEHLGQHFDLQGLCQALRDADFAIVDAVQSSGTAGRLAFELSFLLNEYARPLYAVSIPFLKSLYWVDLWTGPKREGNGLVVLARRN